MTEQFTETIVGVAPEIETVTPQWVVAEEYEKLQARIEELEAELADVNATREWEAEIERVRREAHADFALGMSHIRALGQCTPSRNRTTGLNRLIKWFKPVGL